MADSAVIPHPMPTSHAPVTREVIDVDSLPDLDDYSLDDDVLITQVRRAPPRTFLLRGRPQAPSAAATSSREHPIIVYDSDEEVPAGAAGMLLPLSQAFLKLTICSQVSTNNLLSSYQFLELLYGSPNRREERIQLSLRHQRRQQHRAHITSHPWA